MDLLDLVLDRLDVVLDGLGLVLVLQTESLVCVRESSERKRMDIVRMETKNNVKRWRAKRMTQAAQRGEEAAVWCVAGQ